MYRQRKTRTKSQEEKGKRKMEMGIWRKDMGSLPHMRININMTSHSIIEFRQSKMPFNNFFLIKKIGCPSNIDHVSSY